MTLRTDVVMDPVRFEQRSARARGLAHGEMWREEIAALAEIRMALCVTEALDAAGGDGARARERVGALARAHVDVLRRELPELADELEGITIGSGCSVEDVVVLNQYTDMRDVLLHEGDREPPDDPGGCTAIYVCGADGPVLGQTWDMHASAAPFVRMIRIIPEGSDDELLCFTLTGCLALAGIGQNGVSVAINNLTSTDAGLGVMWPAVVRHMLAAPDAPTARARLLALPLTSGHNYMIADGHDYFGIECSGELKVVTQLGARAAHLHTNHCFDPVLRAREHVPLGTTSFARLDMATTLYAQQRPRELPGLWALLGSHDGHPRGICTHLHEAHGADDSASCTCGRIAMQPLLGRMRAAAGCSRDDRPVDLALERFRGRVA